MRTLLVLLLASASIAAGYVMEDPHGDVAILVAEQQSIPDIPSEPADLWSLAINETPDDIIFEVQSAGRGTATGGQTWDAARLDVRFRHGDNWYDVGTGIEISGQELAELRMREGNSAERIVGALDLETDGAGLFKVIVPRDWLRDHNGAPPQEGSLFEEMHMDAHAHSTGLFLVNPDGTLFQPVGIRDRMPDTGSATYEVQTGGPTTTGALTAEIPLPYRASNGGAALIAYEAFLSHDGGATYNVELVAANPDYTILYPKTLDVDSNTSFQAFVETPDKHSHGGDELISFLLTDAADSANTGVITFGIHYLTIPQPAGHHSEIYFHSRSTPQPLLGQFGGSSNGIVSFNTLENDEADENIGITAGGPGSVAGAWNICLDPELRLGLQANASKTGSVTVSFEGGGAGTATLEWFTATSEDCPNGQNRDALATSSVTGTFDTTHTFELPATEFRLPYDQGRTMGLRIDIIYDQPQTAYTTLVDGEGVLPLDEYYDERPAGLTGDAVVEASPTVEEPEEVEETPAAFGLLLAGLLGVAASRRRF